MWHLLTAIFVLPALSLQQANVWDPPMLINAKKEWHIDDSCQTCHLVSTPEQEWGEDGFHCSPPRGGKANCKECCTQKSLHLGLLWRALKSFATTDEDGRPACACCHTIAICRKQKKKSRKPKRHSTEEYDESFARPRTKKTKARKYKARESDDTSAPVRKAKKKYYETSRDEY